MFAVPGWSVSAKSLVTQKEPRTSSRKESNSEKASKKRKRSGVTEENFADLWRKHIEEKDSPGKSEKKADEQRKKRRKTGADGTNGEAVVNGTEESAGEVVEGPHKDGEDDKGKSHKKKETKKKNTLSESLQQPAGDMPTMSETPAKSEPKKDGKALYEQRKALALEKRSRKSLDQANGTTPPPLGQLSNPPSTTKTARPTKAPEPQLKHQKPPPTTTIAKSTIVTETPPPTTKLTPLQLSMRQKLISARFRHLNQTLYTSPSSQASALFSQAPANYASYHAGFRAQVAVWPQNPIDTFIADIKTRAKVGRGGHLGSQKKQWREQKRGKGPDAVAKKEDPQPAGAKLDPLPRSPRGICTMTDLGCGDATLAGILTPLCKSHSLRIHSFDLAKGDGPNANLITVADVYGKIPLEDGRVDLAIFCLALMGTNWVDGVKEAARIVRSGGEVWVAEIKSRFVRYVANKGKKGTIGRSRRREGEEEEREHIDHEDEDVKKGDETDLGPFVEVFRRRGFVLKGEPDLSNKMFARMRFIKAPTPRMPRDVETQMPKFIDQEEENEADGEEEGKVLKPCVYKIR